MLNMTVVTLLARNAACTHNKSCFFAQYTKEKVHGTSLHLKMIKSVVRKVSIEQMLSTSTKLRSEK